MNDITLHRTLRCWQHELHKKPWVKSDVQKALVVPASLLAPVFLSHPYIKWYGGGYASPVY